MTVRFTLAGRNSAGEVVPPRTKKNHPQLIPRLDFAVIVPSAAYQEWFAAVLRSRKGSPIVAHPITDRVSITAIVYRDREVGDWTGYMDGIADAIQAPMWRCSKKGCGRGKFYVKGSGWCDCGEKLKKVRDGLGVILDDKQIVHWDGSRLRVDKLRPRVEVTIEVVRDGQASIFDESGVLDAGVVA